MRITLGLLALSLTSACMGDGFYDGFADGFGSSSYSSDYPEYDQNYEPPKRSSALDDYYERRSRRADRIILRRNSAPCRMDSTLPIC